MGLFWFKNGEKQTERRVKLAQIIQKIKDDIGSIKKQLDTQVNSFDKTICNHIEDEDKKLDKILSAANGCPEAAHIKLQNGLILDQKIELKEQGVEQIRQGKVQNRILGTLIFCGLLLSFLLFSIFYFVNDKPIKRESKYIDNKIEVLDDMLERHIDKLKE